MKTFETCLYSIKLHNQTALLQILFYKVILNQGPKSNRKEREEDVDAHLTPALSLAETFCVAQTSQTFQTANPKQRRERLENILNLQFPDFSVWKGQNIFSKEPIFQ